MQQISVNQLAGWLQDASRPQPLLLDVREGWEYQLCHLDGSVHIPMHEIPSRQNELDDDIPIVAICHHGMRSMQVALFLEHAGHTQLFNLQGGIDAWARTVDPAMSLY